MKGLFVVLSCCLSAFAGALSLAQDSAAQYWGKRMALRRAALLFSPDILAELALSETEKAAAVKVAKMNLTSVDGGLVLMPTESTDALAVERSLSNVMTPDAFRRLTELWVQKEGAFVLLDPTVQRRLKINEAQLERAERLLEDYGYDLDRLDFELGPDASNEKDRQEREALKKQYAKALEGLLTPDQAIEWSKLKGKAFKFKGGKGLLIPSAASVPASNISGV